MKKIKFSAQSLKCEKTFVLLAGIFGLITVFITPPFQVPDEPNHFFRAYQISEGQFLPLKIDEINYGGVIPASLHRTRISVSKLPFHPEAKITIGEICELFEIRLNPKLKRSIPFNNTSPYSPVLYIPQAMGILLGRSLELPPISFLYFGRIFNLILYISLITTAIKLLKSPKWLFFILGLMPMSLFLGASFSVDSYNIGISFLFIAFFLKLNTEEHKIKHRHVVFLFIITFLTLIGKQGYFLLAGLYFLIPRYRFGTVKKYLTFTALYLLFCCFVVFLWHHASAEVTLQRPGVSPTNQVAFILSHPNRFIQTIIETIRFKSMFYASTFIGTLGWLDVFPSPVFKSYYYMLLFLAGAFDVGESPLAYKKKLLLFSLWVVNSLLILAMIYIWWTPVGDPSIYGVQGRYFIPLAPAFFMIFQNKTKLAKIIQPRLPTIMTISSLGSLSYLLFLLLQRYYFI